MTREALTILEGLHESIMQLRIKNYGIERELYDIDAQVSRAIDHLTALSEPFVPAKHLEGWVKDDEHNWHNGEALLERLGTDNIGQRWELVNSVTPGVWDDMNFVGYIPTQAFFLALCEGLNIKA